MRVTEGMSYIDTRNKVRELHENPKPHLSYASPLVELPKVCKIGIQTEHTLAHMTNTLKLLLYVQSRATIGFPLLD